MRDAWALRIEESQRQTHLTADGVRYPRIRYGDDNPRWGASPCHNCKVIKGQFHVTAECEFETCPKCGGSMSGHTCWFDEYAEDPDAGRPQRRFGLSADARWAIFFVTLFGALATLDALGLI